MFVFGSAANADDSNDGGGRGKASPSADAAPSFAFDATSLPAVTATPPTTKSEDATAAGGFKFNVPPSQDLAAAATEGGEAGVTAPLFGGTFQSRQELLGAGVKTETKHEEAIHGRQQQQNGGSLPDPVTEEELMNSGHKLPEGYTFEKSAAEGATVLTPCPAASSSRQCALQVYGKVQGSKMLAMTWGLICLAGIGFYFRTKDSSKENK
jgi:hypothetical protein